jgi:hypothetical protein
MHDRPNHPPQPANDGPDDEDRDDIPDTPPTEPEPVPIRDPKPDGQPSGPYVTDASVQDVAAAIHLAV